MNSPSDTGSLELSVTNFGPIVEANIDLRPLTVFVGPSNTGKSYLAILIYALHQVLRVDDFDPESERRFRRHISYTLFPGGSSNVRELSKSNMDVLFDWMESTFSGSDRTTSPDTFIIDLPDSIYVMVRSLLSNIRHASDILHGEIRRCFGVETTSRLIRHSSRDGAHVALRGRVSRAVENDAPFKYEFSMRGESHEFTASAPDRPPESVDVNTYQYLWMTDYEMLRREFRRDREERSFLATHVVNVLARSIASRIFNPLSRPAFYLPADRTGVMHAHRVVVGALVQRAASVGLRPGTPVPALSGVLADFLEELIGLDQAPFRERRLGNRLARGLERDLLDGSVRSVPSETGYPSFSYRPEGWKEDLPLANTSSMVSELAPVVLYLRHVVLAGDVLIIEEPESHLHPAMQAAFARQLARLVRAGLRVLVTTHSEWVLDQFANLVRLSALEETQRKGLGEGEALRPEHFGAWLFKPKRRPKGAVVEEIRVDPDAGGLVTGYGEVAEDLYNTWAEIGNRAMEGRR